MKKSKTLIIDLICEPQIDFGSFTKNTKNESFEIAYLKDNDNYKRPYKSIQPIDFDKHYKEAYNKAFKEVSNLGEYILHNNNSVAEELVLTDKKSLWYYFRFMILYKHRKRIFEDCIFELAIKLKKEYKKVIIVTNSSYLNKKSKAGISLAYFNKEEKKAFSNILIFIAITFIRFFLGLPKLLKFWKTEKKHILLSNASSEQNILSIKDFTVKKGDHFTEYLQDKIEFEKEFINISEFFPPKLTDSSKISFKSHYLSSRFENTINLETLIYLQFINPLFYISALQNLIKLHKGFKLIEKDEKKNYLLKEFRSYKRLSYFIGIRKAAIYWVFKFTNYKSISSVNEHDSRVKSIHEVASHLRIRTFGIQHGVIHYRHMHYCFTQFDSSFHPYPDYTFVWGNHWKRVLQEISTYTSEELINVGQLRTDIIPILNSRKNRQYTNRINSSKKFIILYPSQPLYLGEEAMREKLGLDILKLSIDIPNVQIIIKPHPKEKDCEVFFHKLATKIGAKNYIILNEDLYDIISNSDVVTVFNSTVGAEAIYFRKPLIVMNYADNDFSGFIKNKVGKEVNNYKELKRAILLAIKKQEITSSQDIDKFIAERAYKIDGKVANRIIDSIKDKSKQQNVL